MLLEDIIMQAGVDYRRRGAEVSMPCPFCTGQHDTVGYRMIFGVNLESGKAHCHRCDFRSGGMVYTARQLCKAFGIDFSWRMRLSASECDVEAFYEKSAAALSIPSGLPAEYEPFRDLKDPIEKRAFAYLAGRGIGWEEIRRYHIGYAGAGVFGWRVLFPVFGDDGCCYGCAGRDFSGQDDRKYRNTEGIKMLFNGHLDAECAVVVEGPIDAVIAGKAVTDKGVVVVGALGSAITAQELAQLAKYERVIQFPDFDVPGVKGAVKRAKACAAAGISVSVVEPPSMSGEDPGGMSSDEIEYYLRAAKPWTTAQELRMRMSILR